MTNVIHDCENNLNADWNAIPGSKAFKTVQNLRHRIFRATQAGDFKKVKQLQKLMLRCRSNVVTSVRQVTQVNAGKNTPGVDKVLVKTPAARTKLAKELMEYTPWRAKPVKRVYIPKSNGKRRPLGIPMLVSYCTSSQATLGMMEPGQRRWPDVSIPPLG